MSAKQGDVLTALIAQGDRPWNRSFNGASVVVPAQGQLPRVVLAGGAVLTLLAPTERHLHELRPVWLRELKRAGLTPGSARALYLRTVKDGDTTLPASESEQSKNHRVRVSRRTPPASIGVDELAETRYIDDKSAANGSSIAFLAEIADHCLLISGDAFARVLKESIERLLRERGVKRLRLDLFVVPHGGGRSSVNRELLELIACDRYVIATNGDFFGHPDRTAVARIIKYGGAHPTLIFNYRSKFNTVWDSPALQARYGYRTVYPDKEQSGIRVKL